MEAMEFEAAERAFRSVGSLAGEALVAFHDGKPERAVNKALKCARKVLEDGPESDDVLLALWVMRRARERLPTKDAPPHVQVREKRTAELADDALKSMDGEAWSKVREHARSILESYPKAMAGLAEARSTRAFEARMTHAAFQLVITAQDYHEAGVLFQRGDRSREDPQPFPACAICPHCLVTYLGTPDPEIPDDPWWLRKRALKDLLELRPDSPASREEAFLYGIAALHVARFLRTEGKVDYTPMGKLADACLDRACTAPPLRKPRAAASENELRAACEVLRGFPPLWRKDFDAAKGRWRSAIALDAGLWSEEARKQLAEFEWKWKEHLRLDSAIALAKEAKHANEAHDEARELEALEKLLSLELPHQKGDEWVAPRGAFLRVIVRGSRDPQDLVGALEERPEDARLWAAFWEAGKDRAGTGRPGDAVRLLRRVGPSVLWTPEELQTFAGWARASGKPRLRASTLRTLAGKDCAFVAEAAKAMLEAGDPRAALGLLMEDARSACRDAGHRRRASELARELPGLEVREACARAWLDTAPGDPAARAAVASVEGEALRRAEARAREASQEALSAAGDESWERVVTALEGVDPRLLKDELLGHLARAQVQTGHPLEGARTQLLRGQEPEILVMGALWFLQAREPSEALRALRPLAEEVYDGAEPEWLGRTLRTATSDLGALLLAAVGRLREAALLAMDPAVLRVLAQEARAKDDPTSEGLALSRLRAYGDLSEEERARLPELRDRLPLSLKGRVGAPLGREKRLVLLDTNVLIDLLLRDVGEEKGCGLHLRTEVAERVDALRDGSVTLAVPSVTVSEFLARVGAPPDAEAAEGQVAALYEVAEKLVGGLLLDSVLGTEVRACEEHRERAEAFFSRHHEHLSQLTEAKARMDPLRSSVIRGKRRTQGPSTGRTSRDGGTLPERGDIWLLALALRLQELPLPGISSVAILSDDRDFRDLRGPVREAFGIEVL